MSVANESLSPGPPKSAVQYIIAGAGTRSVIPPQAGAGFPYLVQQRVVRCRFFLVRRDNLQLQSRVPAALRRLPGNSRDVRHCLVKRQRGLSAGHREIDTCQQFGIDECAMYFAS